MIRPSLRIKGYQGSARFQGLAKELPKDLFFVAVFVRMLFPNERIGSDQIKLRKILWPKRPELDMLPLQNGLEIKRHSFCLRIRPAPLESKQTNQESYPPPCPRH